MFKIDNQPVTVLLAREKLKVNRFRNIIAITAIALTSILFTTLFTIAGGVIDQVRQSEMRASGSGSHAVIKFLTGSEYKSLSQAGGYKELTHTILIGAVHNKELNKINPELRYGEDEAAKRLRSYPEYGAMPAADNEIAASTIVLDLLGIPAKIGSEVELEFTANGIDYQETFSLSGYWEGDVIAPAQQIWLSKAKTDAVAPVTEIPYDQSYQYSGLICAEIMFSNRYHLEEKLDDLLARAGLEDSHAGIPVFRQSKALNDIDPFTAAAGIILIAVLLLTGYLIIYNIFYISVTQDIQFYGLLKTVGTSAGQLKRIVRFQALLLSIIGLPLGLVTGTLLGMKLLPFLLTQTSVDGIGDFHISGLVLLFSTIFTLLTVYISCIKPCRMAANISPVEAVRYVGIDDKSGKIQKKSGSCSPLAMAGENFKKNRKKAALVILSLMLSLTLLNTIYTGITGFDYEQYIDQYAIADFFVTHYTINSVNVLEKVTDGIDEHFLDGIEHLAGLENYTNVYGNESRVSFDDEHKQKLTGISFDESGQYMLENNQFPLNCYGTEALPEIRFTLTSGSFDEEKWNSGKYAVISQMHMFGSEGVEIYRPGDILTLYDENDEPNEYTIMAVGQLENMLTMQRQYVYGMDLVLHDTEFFKVFGKTRPMTTIFNVSEDGRQAAELFTESYCTIENNDLTYISRKTYEEEFRQNKTMFMLIGGVMSSILGIIGILNFLNTVITSILARKRELAVLGAIGMDARQMKRMLIYESIIYIVIPLLLTATIGLFVSWITGEVFFRYFWAYQWHFTLTPVLISVPFLLLISILVPLAYFQIICKKSIVERLRIE